MMLAAGRKINKQIKARETDAVWY